MKTLKVILEFPSRSFSSAECDEPIEPGDTVKIIWGGNDKPIMVHAVLWHAIHNNCTKCELEKKKCLNGFQSICSSVGKTRVCFRSLDNLVEDI